MLRAVKIGAAAATVAVAAIALSGNAQARFDAGIAAEASSLVQPVYYYRYGYRPRYYAPRYYAPRYYAPRYYAPRYYRYY
jgi:hypothetical protein